MCFIKIHKVNSSKYEWSLDLLTVIFDSWIFITNTKGTKRFYSWMNMHVFYQNPQGEIIKVWMVFRFVDSDFWLLNLYHKVNNKSDTKVLFLIEYSCVLSKSTRWTLQWMIFRFVDSDLWHMNLYHKHKRDTEISVLNE